MDKAEFEDIESVVLVDKAPIGQELAEKLCAEVRRLTTQLDERQAAEAALIAENKRLTAIVELHESTMHTLARFEREAEEMRKERS
jgi:hypothetical protein